MAVFVFLPETANCQCPSFEFSEGKNTLMQWSHLYYSDRNETSPLDRDLDFLNDKFEHEIAQFFRPRLFGYNDDSSFWGTSENPEPVVLYQVSPVDFKNHDYSEISNIIPYVEQDEVYLAITYTVLWSGDEGLGDWPLSFIPDHECQIHKALACAACGGPPTCFILCPWTAQPHCQCSYPAIHGFYHYGDNVYFRLFVKANIYDVSQWELIGMRVENGMWYPREKMSDCIQFDVSGDACHFKIYHSWGKKHSYVNTGPYHHNLYPSECQTNWLYTIEGFEDCGETVETVDMSGLLTRLGEWPRIAHNVGSDYVHLIENLQYLHSDWWDEWAWDDRSFCGGVYHQYGRTLGGDREWLCCSKPECDVGYLCCEQWVQARRASPVGNRWMLIADDWASFDGDEARLHDNCPLFFNVPYEDIDEDGMGDRCDNCPLDFNTYQGDTDHDGVGDVCDLCPRNDSIAIDYNDATDLDPDDDGDRLHDRLCDLCPDSAPPGGLAERWMDDPYDPRRHDFDGDNVGDRCDNCLAAPNRWQDNCNLEYEILWGLEDPSTPDVEQDDPSTPFIEGAKGDACDPDPCVYILPDFEQSVDVEEYQSIIGRRVKASFSLVGYLWNSVTGDEWPGWPRQEALEVHLSFRQVIAGRPWKLDPGGGSAKTYCHILPGCVRTLRRVIYHASPADKRDEVRPGICLPEPGGKTDIRRGRVGRVFNGRSGNARRGRLRGRARFRFRQGGVSR